MLQENSLKDARRLNKKSLNINRRILRSTVLQCLMNALLQSLDPVDQHYSNHIIGPNV